MPDATLTFKVVTDTTGFNAAMESMQAQLRQTNVYAETFNSMMGATQLLGTVGAGYLIAMVAPTLLASKAVGDLDSNLTRMIAIGGDLKGFTGKSTEALSAFNDMAIKFGLSVDDVSAAAVALTKVGYTYTQVMNMLTPVMQLATANQADVAETATIVSEAYMLWGFQISDVATLSNIMNVALNDSAMDLEDLGDIFRYGASSAVVMKAQFKEFMALAGALSQGGVQMGETWGTFFSRLMVDSKTLETNLGAVAGSFVKINEDGSETVDIAAFVDYIQNGTYSLEQWNSAMTTWGVRQAKNLSEVKNLATQFQTILNDINNPANATSLSDLATEMSKSIQNLMASIMDVLYEPLRDTNTITVLRQSLEAFRTELQKSDFASALQSMIKMSAAFVSGNAKTFVSLITNILQLAESIMPVIQNMADSFLSILRVFGDKNMAGLLTFVGVLYTMRKLTPQYIKVLEQYMFQLYKTQVAEMKFNESGAGRFAAEEAALKRLSGVEQETAVVTEAAMTASATAVRNYDSTVAASTNAMVNNFTRLNSSLTTSGGLYSSEAWLANLKKQTASMVLMTQEAGSATASSSWLTAQSRQGVYTQLNSQALANSMQRNTAGTTSAIRAMTAEMNMSADATKRAADSQYYLSSRLNVSKSSIIAQTEPMVAMVNGTKMVSTANTEMGNSIELVTLKQRIANFTFTAGGKTIGQMAQSLTQAKNQMALFMISQSTLAIGTTALLYAQDDATKAFGIITTAIGIATSAMWAYFVAIQAGMGGLAGVVAALSAVSMAVTMLPLILGTGSTYKNENSVPLSTTETIASDTGGTTNIEDNSNTTINVIQPSQSVAKLLLANNVSGI
jgi:TP901 family phage tail tape measure protein